MVDIFTVIADPSRRTILELLIRQKNNTVGDPQDLNVSELVELTGLTQPSVSKQLKVLRDHSLVKVRSEGQQRFYQLENTPFEEVWEWLDQFSPASEREAQAPEATVKAAVGAETDEELEALLPEWPRPVLDMVRDIGEAFSRLEGQAAKTLDFTKEQVEKVKRTGRKLIP